jgi:hypothetical protein
MLVINGVPLKARRDSIKTCGHPLFDAVQPSDAALAMYILKMYVEQAQVEVYEELGATNKSPMNAACDEAASSSGTSTVCSRGKIKGRTDKRGRTRPLAEKKVGDVKSGRVGIANVYKRSNMEYYNVVMKNLRIDRSVLVRRICLFIMVYPNGKKRRMRNLLRRFEWEFNVMKCIDIIDKKMVTSKCNY